MAISVYVEVLKSSTGFIIPIAIASPLLIMTALLPMQVAEDNPDEIDNITMYLFMALPFVILIPLVPMLSRGNAMEIIKTANIEKRMEKLKKLGTKEFIKQTKAEEIDHSVRGNKLYETRELIQNRKLKFLVYKDKSTDREYISFVRDNFSDADEAMASKFNLSTREYEKLGVDNEA